MQSSVILARQYGPRTAATLQSICNLLGETNYVKLLIDGGIWLIDADLTFHENISFEILPDAQFYISAGCVLTVESKYYMFYRTDWVIGEGTLVVPEPTAISASSTILTGSPDLDALVMSGDYYGPLGDGLAWITSTDLPSDVKLLPAYVKVQRVNSENIIQQFSSAAPVFCTYVRSMKDGMWNDWVVMAARMASLNEVRSMDRADLMVSPLMLSGFMNINYKYIRQTTAELLNFPLASGASGKAAERKEPATRFGVTITPAFSNSKILLYGVLNVGNAVVGNSPRIYVNRSINGAAAEEISNATDPGGTNRRVCFGSTGYCNVDYQTSPCPILLVDDVTETTPIEYYISLGYHTTGNIGINRSVTNTDGVAQHHVTSHLFAVELPRKT
jgi:hypothetical protein